MTLTGPVGTPDTAVALRFRYDDPTLEGLTAMGRARRARKIASAAAYGSGGAAALAGALSAAGYGVIKAEAAMARKIASIEITGPVKRRYNNTLRGLASLPPTIRPAGA